MKRPVAICAAGVIAALAIGACGSSSSSSSSATSKSTSKHAVNPNAKETAPPGDIPDSTQFVRFTVPSAGFSVKVPEGWARTGAGGKLTFTSNLNSVAVEGANATGPLSAASVKAGDVPALSRSVKGFKLQSITPIHRGGRTVVRIRYLARAPANAVTGKSVVDAVERYLYAHGRKEAVVTLAGPNGADNVDAWRTISDSLRWSK
jgi:hypothetical protein